MKSKQIVSVFLSILLSLNSALFAQPIVIDTTAAAKHQATMDKAQNGIDIVNIVNPNSRGTSHNKFNKYNVQKQGVILNNSLNVVQTQLGGFIANNPNLTKNAKLILNEVTGTSRTLLEGYTEVGGVKADVIVANPNGITVNGGGFINTDKAILTTGRPNIINGFVEGFNVNQGDILIEGEGFNANNINKVGLYSKLLQLNAKFYADEVQVITGENQIDLDGTITSSQKTGSGISIDSSLLGGVYANRIELISNDKGVGVNLPPEVFAQDSFVLNASGDILVNNLESENSLDINTSLGNITFEDKVYAKSLNINAQDTVLVKNNENATIIAEDSLSLVSDTLNNNAYIYTGYSKDLNTINTASNNSIIVDNINNDGLLASNNLNIEATNITNNGALYSKENMRIESDILDNFEMIRSNQDIELFIKDTLTNNGTIYSDNNLTIAANESFDKENTVNNNAVIQSDNDINIYAKTLNNKASIPTVTSSSNSSTRRTGGGNNYDLITTTVNEQVIEINSLNPAKILAEGNINIDVETLNNFYSLIASNDNITLNANSSNNIGKIIVSTTTVSTKKYRDERYCSRGGPSGSCLRHKNRAAYRGTSTSTTTKKVPVVNFGIQAKNSITGNVVTLNNLSDQLAGNLADQEIQDKLNSVNEKESQSTAIQELSQQLRENNTNIITVLNSEENLSDVMDAIVTDEELTLFKEDLITMEDNLSAIILKDKEVLNTLSTTLTTIKNSFSSSDQLSVTDLESKITQLQTNINANESLLQDFNTASSSIEVLGDIATNKAQLVSLNTDIKNRFSQNTTTLDDIDSNSFISTIVDNLEVQGNNLRDEINVALDLKDNIEYKKISSQDGLYQTNLTTSTQDISNNITSKPSKANNDIFVPEGKFGLFIKNTDPTHKYLIESNSLFTNYNTFISSDYMIGKLDLDTEEISKRLGDAMYETTFVRDMVIKSTGKRRLEGFDSDITQYKALMDNAVSLKDDLQLTFGVSLSKNQVLMLNKDIVWMEEQIVQGEKVLIPQLYLASNNISFDGSQIIANKINLEIEKEFFNDGVIETTDDLNVTAQSITNQNGVLTTGADINLTASKSINNLSGVMEAKGDVILNANEDIKSQTLSKQQTKRHQQGYETNTLRGTTAKVVSGGDIDLTAKNINLKKSDVKAANDVNMQATDVSVDSLSMQNNYDFRFGNGYNKGKNTSNLKSIISADNVTVNANTLSVNSSDITATNNISLEGVKDVKLLATNDLSYQDTQITTSSGFMGKKTTRDMSYKEKVVQSNLVGENITLKSQEENVVLESANLKGKENIVVDAKKDIEIKAKQYREGELHFTKKSSWGGLSKSASMNRSGALNLKEAKLTTEAKNIILKSQNDIKIIASELNSAGDTQLQAANELLISAANEYSKEEKWSKKSSFNIVSFVTSLATLGLANTGPIYELDLKKDEKATSKAKSSSITSGGNITINAGNAKVVGSNVSASKDIVATTDVGSIEVLSAKETEDKHSIDKKIEIGLANIIDVTNSIMGFNQKKGETKLKITLAKATYDKVDSSSSELTNKASNVTSDENITLDSIEDINVVGSNIEAKEDITLKAEQNITIKEAVNTSNTNTKETHAKAEVNLTVQNEYVEAAKAYKEVDDARKQLSQARKDYKKYKNDVKNLEARLTTIKAEYKNKTPGISKDDVSDLSEIISDIKSDEKYYIASIAASVANLTSKTTIAVQQTAAAAASSGTYGFSAGLSLDVEGSKTKTDTSSTTAVASNIKANNISIETKTDKNNKTLISGSSIKANENLDITTKDLDIISSVNTTSSASDTKDISGSVSMTVYGAASGPQVSLGYGEQHNTQDSVTNNNSKVEANNISITTSNDTNIKGANVKAEDTLTLNVGNDLNIESQRDTYNSNLKGFNISAGVGTNNGSISSANGGVGANKGRVKVKETVLTSVTGDNVEVNVAQNTNLKGSVLASGQYDANGKLIDNDNLKLTTKTLTYQDSSNVVYDNSNSFNIAANIGIGQNSSKNSTQDNSDGTKINSSSLQYSNNKTYSKTKTLATLGNGEVDITDEENSDDTTALNRDTQNLNKDIYNVNTGVKIDMTLDHRLLSEEGRKEIKEDYKQLNKNMNIIAGTLPDENSDNQLEATVGKVWNTLTKYLTLGLIPSNENRGGIIAEIPILTGENDSAHKKLLVVNKSSEKFNENDYIKMEESSYYKALSQEDKVKFNGKGLYVSKNSIEISSQTSTYQNAVNGMMNNIAEAIKNGLEQTGQMGTGKTVELTVGYNPSYGFIPDLVESLVDKSGIGTTGIAKQTGEFIDQVTTKRGDNGSNFAMHSQGNALVYNGIKYVKENGGYKPVGYYETGKLNTDGSVESDIPTFVSFGSPMNKIDMESLIQETLEYKYSGAYTKEGDFVGEVLGGNKGNNQQSTVTDRLNVLNAYKLFTSNSPHSTYICQEYADEGVRCGYKK